MIVDVVKVGPASNEKAFSVSIESPPSVGHCLRYDDVDYQVVGVILDLRSDPTDFKGALEVDRTSIMVVEIVPTFTSAEKKKK